ncbi:MAG: histone deacetylase family protein [Boseongicola sp.]|nr:histone deacetylase family protein [Boseongicola sp.]
MMRVYASETHRAHFPKGELSGGVFVRPFECPERVDIIRARLDERGFGDVREPEEADLESIRSTTDAGYLAFLEHGHEQWRAAGNEGDLIATNWPARRMQQSRPPRDIDGRAGYYALASETAICEGTWVATLASAACAQDAAKHVANGAGASFALCRPPGHHATSDMYGGYCFLNNAGLAAETLRAGGASRVAIIDVDFHHGNGTQDMFYSRGDVFFASLHGAPEDAFPYFSGYSDETGIGTGEGATANYPMPSGTTWERWSDALDDALTRALMTGADALVISLGVDAYKEDPISFFKLESEDFTRIGERIGKLRKPTVFCMEGGYAVDAIGVNTVNVLEGFSAV